MHNQPRDVNARLCPSFHVYWLKGLESGEGGGDPHVNSFPLNEYVMETDEANDS